MLNTLGRLYGEKIIHDNLLASNVVSRSGNYRLINTKRTPTHTRRWKKDNPNWDEKKLNGSHLISLVLDYLPSGVMSCLGWSMGASQIYRNKYKLHRTQRVLGLLVRSVTSACITCRDLI